MEARRSRDRIRIASIAGAVFTLAAAATVSLPAQVAPAPTGSPLCDALSPSVQSAPGRLVAVQPARRLTSSADSDPWVSADGRTVVFSREPRAGDRGRTALWTVALEGGEARRLTPSDFPYDATRPAWSPDGSHIAFRASDSTDNGRIWLISAAGADVRPMMGVRGNDYYPRWFRDGRGMLVSRDVPGRETDLWLIDLKSKRAQQMTSHPTFDGAATLPFRQTAVVSVNFSSCLRREETPRHVNSRAVAAAVRRGRPMVCGSRTVVR